MLVTNAITPPDAVVRFIKIAEPQVGHLRQELTSSRGCRVCVFGMSAISTPDNGVSHDREAIRQCRYPAQCSLHGAGDSDDLLICRMQHRYESAQSTGTDAETGLRNAEDRDYEREVGHADRWRCGSTARRPRSRLRRSRQNASRGYRALPTALRDCCADIQNEPHRVTGVPCLIVSVPSLAVVRCG